MNWEEFLQTAYPESMARVEAGNSTVWRANRWLGLRFAYVFYHLGFSANLLSIARCLLALIGFYLLSLVAAGNQWEPILGALILTWQINLDYADGSIARVQGKASEFGEKMDGLANASSRAVVLVLAGFLTNNAIMFLISAFSAYVLVTFVPALKVTIKTSGTWRPLALLYRVLLYVPVMVCLLPMLIAVHGVLGLEVVAFSYIVVCIYAVLAALWLILCLWSAGKEESPFLSIIEHS